MDKCTAEYERATLSYELIKRSVDDPNVYKDVYAIEKRVEAAREQVEKQLVCSSITTHRCSLFLARANEKQDLTGDG